MEDRYRKFWGSQKNRRPRLPLPCSLDRDNIGMLESEPYMVAYKTDGDRRVLYAHCDGQFFWVDRNDSFVQSLGHSTSPNIFAGTILDGEYVDTVAPPIFLVFDCVALTGTPVHRQPLARRLLHAVTASRLIRLDGVRIRVKTTVKAVDLCRLLRLKDPDGVPSDGLIFTPANHAVSSMGTCMRLLKWKQPSHHTVDLRCRHQEYPPPRENLYTVLSEDGRIVGRDVEILARTSTTEEEARGCTTSSSVDVALNKKIVEFQWCPHKSTFLPCYDPTTKQPKIREDKPRANTLYVVERTLQAIKDNVTVHDLLALRYLLV